MEKTPWWDTLEFKTRTLTIIVVFGLCLALTLLNWFIFDFDPFH